MENNIVTSEEREISEENCIENEQPKEEKIEFSLRVWEDEFCDPFSEIWE